MHRIAAMSPQCASCARLAIHARATRSLLRPAAVAHSKTSRGLTRRPAQSASRARRVLSRTKISTRAPLAIASLAQGSAAASRRTRRKEGLVGAPWAPNTPTPMPTNARRARTALSASRSTRSRSLAFRATTGRRTRRHLVRSALLGPSAQSPGTTLSHATQVSTRSRAAWAATRSRRA